jgi:tripartite ATP-independent transporter DctP family solute receptor
MAGVGRNKMGGCSLSAVTRRGALALGAGALAACSQRQGGLLYSSDAHPDDYPTVLAVQEMGRLLSERTGGELGVKIFAGGQLGSESDMLEIASFGGIDLNRVNLAPLNAIEPLTKVASLPFLFSSQAHMRRALDGGPGRKILDSLFRHNLVGLCFYDSGERSFYNTRGPIYEPGDLAGLKIRVQNSDLFIDLVNALGASSTPMPYGDIYQALLQRVIDGAENNWPSYDTARHFEVAPYYSLTRHVMTPEVLVMSRARWTRLSASHQEAVRASARDSVPFMRKLWDARVEDSIARVKAGGVKVNEVAELGQFKRRVESVWRKHAASEAQAALVKDIQAMAD